MKGMQRFYVHVPNTPKKSHKRIPSPWKERLFEALEGLEQDPYRGIKMLGEYADCYKLRVWPYRIIYRVKKKERVVEILEIERRGNASYD